MMKFRRNSSAVRLFVTIFSPFLLLGYGCGGSDSTSSKSKPEEVSIPLNRTAGQPA